MKILYIFTFDYSFKIWKETGILDREIEYFNRLGNENIELTIFTFGDESDEDLLKDYNFKCLSNLQIHKKASLQNF